MEFLNDDGIKKALGIMINKIFFKGGLKIKDNLETTKNARTVASLLAYIQQHTMHYQKPGSIAWFSIQWVDRKCSLKKLYKSVRKKLESINKKIQFKEKAEIVNIVKTIQEVVNELNKNDKTKVLCSQKIQNIINSWEIKLEDNSSVAHYKVQVEQIIAGKKQRKSNAKNEFIQEIMNLKSEFDKLGNSVSTKQMQSDMLTAFDKICKVLKFDKINNKINKLLKAADDVSFGGVSTGFLCDSMRNLATFCLSIAVGYKFSLVIYKFKDNNNFDDLIQDREKIKKDEDTEMFLFEKDTTTYSITEMDLRELKEIKRGYFSLNDTYLWDKYGPSGVGSHGGLLLKEHECVLWAKAFVKKVIKNMTAIVTGKSNTKRKTNNNRKQIRKRQTNNNRKQSRKSQSSTK